MVDPSSVNMASLIGTHFRLHLLEFTTIIVAKSAMLRRSCDVGFSRGKMTLVSPKRISSAINRAQFIALGSTKQATIEKIPHWMNVTETSLSRDMNKIFHQLGNFRD
jgi:hypothetical protein